MYFLPDFHSVQFVATHVLNVPIHSLRRQMFAHRHRYLSSESVRKIYELNNDQQIIKRRVGVVVGGSLLSGDLRMALNQGAEPISATVDLTG